MSLTERIRQKALELGFDLVGVAPAGRAARADAYTRWLERGLAGEMAYLTRDPQRRQDTREIVPGARSVVVVGLSYYTVDLPESVKSDPSRGLIARYAWGLDYHDVMLPRLRELARFVRGETVHPVNARACVDTAPVLERDIAEQAGLGFTGKNTCLIHPRLGSWLFLGEIVLDIDLEYDAPIAGVGCGTCARCLAACPTDAFPSPYVLDARRCISYLTIELRGGIPRKLRSLMRNRIFGCDDCQDVCPWPRRFATPAAERSFYPVDLDRAAPRLLDLIHLTDAQFRERFTGTPILRAKRRGLLRNVAVALGNWADPAAVPALARALNDAEPLVRQHAAWALGATAARQARDALEARRRIETSASVQEEIEFSLSR